MRLASLLALLLAGGLVVATRATAADQPIGAQRLVMKRTATRGKLVFVSKDPAVLFAVPGSADDPATGTPGGMLVEIFSHAESMGATSIPPGEGRPGWKVREDRYLFSNRTAPGGPSPFRIALLRRGRMLKVMARTAGLALVGPQGSVGIRITTGSLRNCALFDAATVQHDEAGFFAAAAAQASALADCSDASLGPSCGERPFPFCGGPCPPGSVCGPTPAFDGCVCISSSQPCGSTAPICNGECPAGEECASFDGYPLRTCACLPVGSTPCGGAAPACGGDCPGAQVCRLVSVPAPPPPGGQKCICANPGPCDATCGGADCTAGFACAIFPGQGCGCAAMLCNGGEPYPTCGGTCPGTQACAPFVVSLGAQLPGTPACVCIDGSVPCDAACGGAACPSGQACTYDSGTGSCACVAF